MKHKYYTPGGPVYQLYADALNEPHLLIAGATGSGKSVIINGLIYALLHRLPGGQRGAQMILIDPKRVELAKWRNTPHCKVYASEPDEMIQALLKAMDICETRYKAMQKSRAYKYDGADLYVIVDEFADLMTTQGKTVKPLVQRLAQIGRAARVHLIIATQTPISKVIPTEIKCNFDSRFGLRARSAQDSRNIIGRAGLELLPRYGQAVFMSPAGDFLTRVPMIPDDALTAMQTWWSYQKRSAIGKLFWMKPHRPCEFLNLDNEDEEGEED